MRDFLKKYDGVLETVGPVFIGSGQELSKKEYILEDSYIKVIDIPKLYLYLKQKHLQNDFEGFMLSDKRDLKGWLRYNRLFEKDIKDCIKYKIDHADTVLSRGTKNNILEFVKNPYGQPYVPGSSIKGMLRTILLGSELLKKSDTLENDKKSFSKAIEWAMVRNVNRNLFLQKEEKNLEANFFNLPDNDIFSGLRVSDSEPISFNDMILCQRIEYHKDGMEKGLPILRECIKPGTRIKFSITVDETIFHYSNKQIMDAIASFSSMYDEVFKKCFKGMSGSKPDTCYLGGGVGFVSKTDIYPLFGKEDGIKNTVKIFKATKVSNKHKHYNDTKEGVSPHILKTTRYKGNLYNMGECRFKFV